MAPSTDPLNFFILEASECLERLDTILGGAGPTGPDATEFVRHARTLRGAAIMHKQTGIAELAGATERAGRGLRDGQSQWSPALAAALVAAVDDLKILLHNVRIWGPNEEARATRRLADLGRFAPPPEAASPRHSQQVGVGGASLAFLSQEAAATAAALDAVARPGASGGGSGLDAALARVRTLRGVAAVHDIPPVPDVLDTVEQVARSLEVGHGSPTSVHVALFAAAAAVLRRTAGDIRSVGRSVAGTPEERRFMAARDALIATRADAERIVPIDNLFYTDGGSGIVAVTANPPTTPAERFRLEVVSMAEHLRLLVRDAQSDGAGPLPDRVAAELRAALQAVRSAAESFGERDVADFLTSFTEGHPAFDFLTLNAVDELASLLADPTTPAHDLAQRMADLTRGRALDVGIGFGLGSPGGAAPARGAEPGPRTVRSAEPPPALPSRDRVRTPTGRALQALLADGIAGISPLADLPLAEHTTPPGVSRLPDGDVPIEALLYRGEAALRRARALRDVLRSDHPPETETLAELFDLIDLAASA